MKDTAEIVQGINSEVGMDAINTVLNTLVTETGTVSDDIVALESVAAQLEQNPEAKLTPQMLSLFKDTDIELDGNESFGNAAAAVGAKIKELAKKLLELIKRGVRYLVDMISDNAHVMGIVEKNLKKIIDGLRSGSKQMKAELNSDDLNSIIISAMKGNDPVKHFKKSVSDLDTFFVIGFADMARLMRESIANSDGSALAAKQITSDFNAHLQKHFRTMFTNYSLKDYGIRDAQHTLYSDLIFGGYVIGMRDDNVVNTSPDDKFIPLSFNARRGVSNSQGTKLVPLKIKDVEDIEKAVSDQLIVFVDRHKSIVDRTVKEVTGFISKLEKADNGERNNEMRALANLLSVTMFSSSAAVIRAYRAAALAANELVSKSVEKAS